MKQMSIKKGVIQWISSGWSKFFCLWFYDLFYMILCGFPLVIWALNCSFNHQNTAFYLCFLMILYCRVLLLTYMTQRSDNLALISSIFFLIAPKLKSWCVDLDSILCIPTNLFIPRFLIKIQICKTPHLDFCFFCSELMLKLMGSGYEELIVKFGNLLFLHKTRKTHIK